MDNNSFLAALWQGLEPLLTYWWPVLLLLLALNLAKPWLKKQRKRGRKPKRFTGFFEQIPSITNDARGARHDGAVAGDEEPFKAGDTLPDQLNRKSTKADRNYSEELMDQGGAYVARTHLMSPLERQVYKVLEEAYGDRYYIFCQVRVVDLIQPNMKKHHSQTREYKSLFRQLSQWHFDYVLCERDGFKIICAVELDDPSHERGDRKKRDRILNNACESAGLMLKRVNITDNKIKPVY